MTDAVVSDDGLIAEARCLPIAEVQASETSDPRIQTVITSEIGHSHRAVVCRAGPCTVLAGSTVLPGDLCLVFNQPGGVFERRGCVVQRSATGTLRWISGTIVVDVNDQDALIRCEEELLVIG